MPAAHSAATRSYRSAGSVAGWTALSTPIAPGDRGNPAIASSPIENLTLLFSGAGINSVVDNQTWEFANGSWSNLTSPLARAPPPAAGASLVWDAADGYFLLFGGISAYGGVAENETWTFANHAWTNRTSNQSVAPPARYVSAMAYDARDGYVVLFGGATDTGVLGDTWTYSGGTWTNRTGSLRTAPPAREYAAMTYDARTGEVILYGGATPGAAQTFNDTWTFSGGVWTNITATAGPAPAARRGAAFAYDPNYGYDLLFGGDNYSYGIDYSDTWIVRQDRWTNITADLTSSPSTRFSPGLVYDPTAGALLLFGGCTAIGCALSDNDSYRYEFNLTAPTLTPSATRLDANTSWTLTTRASGGSFDYRFNYSGLPPGCASVNASSLVCRPASRGNYTPSVNVTDLFAPAGGPPASASATSVSVEVFAALSVVAAPSRAVLDVGQSVWLNATVSGGLGPMSFSYSGLPAGCASADTSALACSPTRTGSFSPVVTVRDSLGATARNQTAFTVYASVSLGLLVSSRLIEVGQSVNVTAAENGGAPPVNLTWPYLPTGCAPSGTDSVLCLPPTPGALNLSARLTDDAGATVVAWSGPIDVVARVSVGVNATANGGTAPFTAILQATVAGGIGPYTYSWSFGDGTSLTSAADLTHVYSAPGSYTVTVRANDSVGFSAIGSLVLEVLPPPTVAVGASAATVDVGQNTTLTATVANLVPPVTYDWVDLPRGCPGANASTLQCHPLGPGNYSVRLDASDPLGASAFSQLTLLVLPTVTASIGGLPPSTCSCACGTGVVANFSALVSGGDPPYRIGWDFGDGGTSTSAAPVHSYLPGSVSVTRNVTLRVNDSLGEAAISTASVLVPAGACPASGAGGSTSSPLLWGFLGGVGLLAGVLAFVAVRRSRGRPSEGEEVEPTGEPDPSVDSLTRPVEEEEISAEPPLDGRP